MKKTKASVTFKDFKAHNEGWCSLRQTMQHQPSSIMASRKDLKVFITFCRKKNIRRITGLTLVNFFNYIHNTRKNCSGSINRKRSTLRCYFEYLRLKQVKGAHDFPIDHLPRARQPYSGPVNTLESKEVFKILDSIDRSTAVGMRDFALYSLLYALGLRLGEALSIRLGDIDWENGILTIRGKGNKIRTLPLTDKLKCLIKKWIYCRGVLLNAGNADWLFLSRKGNRLSGRTAEERFASIIKTSGPFSIKKVTPHSLRHAFASHAVDGNADLLVVKTLMGHATLRTTEIYLHPSKETLRLAVNDHLANDLLQQAVLSYNNIIRVNARKAAGG